MKTTQTLTVLLPLFSTVGIENLTECGNNKKSVLLALKAIIEDQYPSHENYFKESPGCSKEVIETGYVLVGEDHRDRFFPELNGLESRVDISHEGYEDLQKKYPGFEVNPDLEKNSEAAEKIDNASIAARDGLISLINFYYENEVINSLKAFYKKSGISRPMEEMISSSFYLKDLNIYCHELHKKVNSKQSQMTKSRIKEFNEGAEIVKQLIIEYNELVNKSMEERKRDEHMVKELFKMNSSKVNLAFFGSRHLPAIEEIILDKDPSACVISADITGENSQKIAPLKISR